MSPGPNDFHFSKDPVTGVLVQKPGLGEFEPTPADKQSAADRAAEYRRKDEELDRIKADIRGEALALEERSAGMDAREAALAAREAELETLTAPNAETPAKRRALATERA